jgi:hypothetical protein
MLAAATILAVIRPATSGEPIDTARVSAVVPTMAVMKSCLAFKL